MVTHQHIRNKKNLSARERLLTVGASNLSDVDLLSLILGSGTKKNPVTILAKKIVTLLKHKEINHVSAHDLGHIVGIGTAQASRIVATLELGRRFHHQPTKKIITTSQDVLDQVAELRNKHREHAVVLYLNARQELLSKETVSIGGLNVTHLQPRDVFATALTLPSAYVILVHNHPSGNSQPSQEDMELTIRFVQAGELLGVSIIDHIIIASNQSFSFREAELL